MKNKDRIILNKVLDYCTQCEAAMCMFERSFEKFKSNSVFQNACCMCILQIGELCKVISDELRTSVTDIPWKQWCGVRDIFAHQYSNLDYESAWDTITKDLPTLEERVHRLLSENRTNGDQL